MEFCKDEFVLNWKHIRIMIFILLCYNLIMLMYSTIIILSSYEIYKGIGIFVNLISNQQNGTIYCMFILCSGFINFCFNLCAIIIILCSLTNTMHKKVNELMLVHVIGTGILIFVLGAQCLLLVSSINTSLILQNQCSAGPLDKGFIPKSELIKIAKLKLIF